MLRRQCILERGGVLRFVQVMLNVDSTEFLFQVPKLLSLVLRCLLLEYLRVFLGSGIEIGLCVLVL